jgi:2-phosphoglycolate phosphatase
MNTLPGKQCFIFDMDGTIIDTARDIVRTTNLTLVEFGLEELPDDLITSFIGGGIPRLVERALGDRADELMDRMVPRFTERYEAEPAAVSRPYPGVMEVMHSIKQAGGQVAICTQKAERIARKITDTLDMSQYVDSMIGPESVTHRKPHPEPVLKVLSELSVPASAAIFVGDTAADIASGNAAGVMTCAVSYGYGSIESMRPESPTFEIDAMDELFTHVTVTRA